MGVTLRTKTNAGCATKGAALNWDEMDDNFIALVNLVNSIAGAGGVLSLQGGYVASTNPQYPTLADTLLGDNPQKGYCWYATDAGTINGISVAAGAFFFAKVDNAGPTNNAQWVIIESTINMSALFIAWAASLPDYDNTKQRVLATVGGGSDTFAWIEVQQP